MDFTTGLTIGLIFGGIAGALFGTYGSLHILAVSDSDTETEGENILPEGYQPKLPKQAKQRKRRGKKKSKRPRPPRGGSGVPNKGGG